LSCFSDETQIREYIDRTLGKLLRYDKRKNQAYLATLEIILMSDNLKGSAETLGIHYHTLMFRKQRLEQILEVSFEDYAARLAILNALHMLKLRNN
jgi:DNA-binding PucR family transcriptional regulator